MDLPALLEKLQSHWLSFLFFCLTVATVLSVWAFRCWMRRRWRRLLEDKFDQELDLDVLTPLGPEDLEARERIKEFRREVWRLPEAELRLSTEGLIGRGLEVVRAIAAIYHPRVEAPEYEASLVESLQLVRRVATRLIRLSNITPVKFLGNQKLSDYQRYYQVYRRIHENPFVQGLKRYRTLHRVARWAVNVKNMGNPIYWVSRELSREGYFFALRWFHRIFVTQVGREAIRLYSERYFQKEEDRDAMLVCQRLFHLTRHWGGPSAWEWGFLVGFVTEQPGLEDEMKLRLLSQWSRNKVPANVEEQPFQTPSGPVWYRKGLDQLVVTPFSSPEKTRRIEEELASLEEAQHEEAPL